MVKNKLAKLKVNSVIKAIILAEMLLWSAWNFIMPIFSIYVSKLPNGSVEKAASSFSVYLLTRVVFGLASGKYLTGKRTRHKLFFLVMGMSLLSLSYLGLAIAPSMQNVYFFYAFIGIALGIASPAKNSLFSTNLSKEKDTFIWSILDAGVFLSMALAAFIGGVIAEEYGFSILFYIAALLSLASIIPYLIYVNYWIKNNPNTTFAKNSFQLSKTVRRKIKFLSKMQN